MDETKAISRFSGLLLTLETGRKDQKVCAFVLCVIFDKTVFVLISHICKLYFLLFSDRWVITGGGHLLL